METRPTPPPPSGKSVPGDWFAWADAALLSVLAVMVVYAAQPGVKQELVVGITLCAVIAAHLALITVDYGRNARTFERFPNVVVGLLLPPVYFGWRSVRFRYVGGWLMLGLWCLGLVLQALAASLLASPRLPYKLVGVDVSAQLVKIMGQPVDVRCPDNIPAQAGRTVECRATIASGATFPVVLVVSGSGVDVIAVPIFAGGVKPQ